MLSKRLWSGSTKTIFFPSLTHFFAQAGFVRLYTPDLARRPAQSSSESQPRRTNLSLASCRAGATMRKMRKGITLRRVKSNIAHLHFCESTTCEVLSGFPLFRLHAAIVQRQAEGQRAQR